MLVPVPRFNDIREFNKELLKRCDKDMQRKHYKKGKDIIELFEIDKASMNPLPEVQFEVYDFQRTR